jgi:hypothetical protein
MLKAKTIKIQFKSDHHKLLGTLHLPDNYSLHTPCIIGSHGLFSDSSSPKQLALARQCNQKNMAYFRFDHRGCGKSEGDFKKDTTITNRFRDFCAAIQTMRDDPDIGDQLGYFGSSLGGTVALLASLIEPPQTMVTLSAPISMNSVWDVLVKNRQDERLSKDFYDEAINFNIQDQLHQINNLLIFHGSDDEVVPVVNAKQLRDDVSEPSQLFVFDGGCHQLANKTHQELFMQKTTDWFECYFHGDNQSDNKFRSNV